MPKWSREYLLTAVLAGVAAVLALSLAVEWLVLERSGSREVSPPSARTAPAPIDDTEIEGDFELPPLEDYRQMVERPLFMETRRPGAETNEAAAPQSPPRPINLKLMGVVWTPHGKIALLVDAKGKYRRLKMQDMLDGWTLVDLESDRATLQQGEKREVLPLLKKRPKPPPGTQPAPAPPPGQPAPPAQPAPAQPSGQGPVPAPQPQPGTVGAGEDSQDVPEDEPDDEAAGEDGSGGETNEGNQ